MTARITEQDKINGLQVGGNDYITKPFSLQELTARVAAHLRRDERSKCTPEIVSSQGLIVNLAEHKVFYGEIELKFSNCEFDIFEYLMRNANQIFDKERIYEARKNSVIYNLYSERSIPSFAYQEMYNYYLNYDFSTIFVLLLCLYGIVSTFVCEKETQMEMLL